MGIMIIKNPKVHERFKTEIKGNVPKEFIVRFSNLIQKTYADKG